MIFRKRLINKRSKIVDFCHKTYRLANLTLINSAISVNQEKTLYLTFVCLTITFLVCHLPRIILNIYEVPMNKRRFLCQAIFNKTFYQPLWVIILTSVEKLTLIINSSINFFFYCLVGKAFRKQLYQVRCT